MWIKKNLLLSINFLFMCNVLHAACPVGYDEIGASVYGQSKVRVDWIGRKAVTPKGVVSASGSLCFSSDGKNCLQPFNVVLNTGSEAENFIAPRDSNKKYSICMGDCYRSHEEQPDSNDSPGWHKINSCIFEFKARK